MPLNFGLPYRAASTDGMPLAPRRRDAVTRLFIDSSMAFNNHGCHMSYGAARSTRTTLQPGSLAAVWCGQGTATYRTLSLLSMPDINLWKCTHSALDWSPLKISSKSITQGYPRFFSLQFLTVTIQNVCGKMFNKLLCRKSSTHLPPPPSSSGISHADSFANFFTDKISQLRISLTSNISTLCPKKHVTTFSTITLTIGVRLQ